MNASYSELRARARDSLRGNWGKAIGGFVLSMLMAAVVSLLNYLIPILGNLVGILISGSISLGLISFFLGIARKENPPVSEVFSGFSLFIKAFCLYFMIGLFTFLWTLLLIIPGIIAALRYSQAYFILRDNPDIGVMDAIRESRQLMIGNKWRYFVLQLTFIGWAILAAIPFGIGYLWLCPYISVTQAHFYDNVTGRSQAPAPDSF
ncbi:Uncharacterized membrane protein [Paenibacillus catalpae]|uniref:Uncharacterized membrane protein n=1 Tax=Paenibacillus catalpae TaxID=1045775 RepID=A0A1I2DCG1_9BACL|nr:DUF975 family protein [Paenibacillus catalpae]SFE78187.1 Uncharacterized membrane protein [Paenibacillus catalpae]